MCTYNFSQVKVSGVRRWGGFHFRTVWRDQEQFAVILKTNSIHTGTRYLTWATSVQASAKEVKGYIYSSYKYTGYEKSRERSLFKVKFCHSEIYSSRNWTNKSKPRLQIDMFYGAVWCCMKSCFREATGRSARQYIQYTSGIKCYHFFFLNFSMLSIVLLSVTSSPCPSCALSSARSTMLTNTPPGEGHSHMHHSRSYDHAFDPVY